MILFVKSNLSYGWYVLGESIIYHYVKYSIVHTIMIPALTQ